MAPKNTLNPSISDGELIEHILSEHARIPYPQDTLQAQTVFDQKNQRYLLLTLGWQGYKRVHGVVVDVELRGNKFWIHHDGTEQGIARELELAGIPKDRIVLAWLPESYRKHSEFAVK